MPLPSTHGCDLPPSELAEAFERVAENAGCAGVDDVSVEEFGRRLGREVERLSGRIRAGRYVPLPLRKIVVEKAPGSAKMRRLLVPAVRDRVAQTAVARRMSRSFEEEFLEVSYAYRPGRGVDRAVARILQLRDRGFEHVVDGDIREFFDRVDHSLLLERLAGEEVGLEYFGLVEQWVRAEVWDGSRVRRLARGVPQGSPISPLLANFFLGEFDRELSKGGGGQQQECHLVRYADDFLLLCASEEAARAGLERIRGLLEGLRLSLHPEKTRITHFHEGFLFLGVYFFGNRAWIPWKEPASGGGGRMGDLLYIAKPMPERLLARYEAREQLEEAPATEMQAAFRRLGAAGTVVGSSLREGTSSVAYLYITEQGSVVRKAGDRYLVECGERIVLDLPYHKLECVLLFGRVQVTTQALTEMLDRGIRVALFSRQGRYRVALVPARKGQVELRLAQFELYRNEGRALGMARATIAAKLANSLAVLERYKERVAGGGQGDLPEGFVAGQERVKWALAQVEGQAGSQMESDALLGYEGTAAKAYFQALMGFNKSGLAWEGRVKRPATDPLNALLSLTYVLLMQEFGGAAEALGLDPHIGFLHRLEDGRPSLALDLLEPFRSVAADRFVMALVNRGVFGAADFAVQGGSGAVHLRQEALRKYLGHYEKWMQHKRGKAEGTGVMSIREILWAETRRYAAVLRGGWGKSDGAAADEGVWMPYRWGETEECNTSSLTI